MANKESWQCGGCKTWYAPSVEKCECQKDSIGKQLDQPYIAPYQPYEPYPYKPWRWVDPIWVWPTVATSGTGSITIKSAPYTVDWKPLNTTAAQPWGYTELCRPHNN